MILRFPYQEELLAGPPPPSLPPTAQGRWQPLVPVTVYGPGGHWQSFGRAFLNSGADNTIFPLDVATQLGGSLLPATGHGMRWRGQRQLLRFGMVELELVDDVGAMGRWPATIAFTAASIRYPLLGIAGCLEYLDVKFLGKERMIELEPNDLLPSLIGP